MATKESQKKLDHLQMALVLIFAMPMGWALLQFQNGLMTKDEAILWFAISFFLMALIDAWLSIKRGTSWAKGVKISRETTPNLFMVNVAI